ncbi:MAG TPA: amidohydrolase family protein [Bryobacteraceae bacterium]|nr:amidohydrolase family protein [Bryobacteraceae bacterium]
MRYLRHFIPIVVAAAAALYFSFVFPLRDPHPRIVFPDNTLAIRDVRIYTTPDSNQIEHGTVLARNGVIVAAGAGVVIPQNTQILECPNCTVTAGFWNAHAHFTESKWDFAAYKSSDTLNDQLADMLTSRGFTTVVDLGSDIRQTISLRRRIETGDLKGPTIYSAGSGIYPPHGIPYYLGSMPLFIRWLMPQPETPQAAERVVESGIARGADVLKLFTGSIVEPHRILPMPEDIARAAVNVAHRHGQVAFAHPSNLAGTKVAIDSGVDVLAHAPSVADGIDQALLQSIFDRRMSMIPTLKMFATTVTADAKFIDPIHDIVRRYHSLGGDLIFGTDVGYMEDYSTDDEFRALAQCGLNFREILRMLTVAPAIRLKADAQRGTVTPGKMADLVVLDGDPGVEIAAFSRVHFTVRNGRLIYERSR